MVETPQVLTTSAAPEAAAVAPTPAVEASATSIDSSPTQAESSIDSVSKDTQASTETPSASETVLGEGAKIEAKVDSAPETKADSKTQTKPETDTPPADIKTETEAKIEFPTYEEFKLPEGLDKAPVEDFKKILGEIEIGKLDHAGMQEVGQKLIDLAAKTTAESIERMNDYYVQIHESNKKARLDALKADPDLGGDRFADTVSALQSAIAEYGGTEAQIAEFRKEVTEAGLDASPALCRILYNMQQKINKYTTESDNSNGGSNRIVPGARPAPSKVKDYQRFYAGGNS